MAAYYISFGFNAIHLLFDKYFQIHTYVPIPINKYSYTRNLINNIPACIYT